MASYQLHVADRWHASAEDTNRRLRSSRPSGRDSVVRLPPCASDDARLAADDVGAVRRSLIVRSLGYTCLIAVSDTMQGLRRIVLGAVPGTNAEYSVRVMSLSTSESHSPHTPCQRLAIAMEIEQGPFDTSVDLASFCYRHACLSHLKGVMSLPRFKRDETRGMPDSVGKRRSGRASRRFCSGFSRRTESLVAHRLRA